MPVVLWIYRNVFNSVPFGIATMVAIGLYVAIGSGVVSVREYLEMDEMLFFNWWPLKLLIVLLIINLVAVTITRIPLTVPRYGVWCIHMGIILLLMSLSAYYTLKIEGMVPLIKGQTATRFYDRWERALYVRTNLGGGPAIALPELPRFREYDHVYGNHAYMDKPSLRDLSPQVRAMDVRTDRRSLVALGESLGLKDPIKLDVVGYYPYAEAERWRIDPKVNNVGLRVRKADAPVGTGGWLVASQAAESIIPLDEAVLEHRHVPTQADIELSTGAARRLHKLAVRVGNVSQETFVEPGEELTVGDGGYTIKVEGFTPQFQLSDGKTAANTITLLISKGAAGPMKPREFRRTVLSKQDTQTDFELNVEGAGPFGKRKRDGLLDDALQIKYTFSDPTKLLPTVQQSTVKYLLFTSDEKPGLTLLRVSARDASSVSTSAENRVDLHVVAPAEMFSGAAGDRELAHLVVERFDHVSLSNGIVAIEKGKRIKEEAAAGHGQMVRVRVRCGSWSQDVPVAFDQFALENSWTSPKVKIPGATGEFQMMLGNFVRPLPVAVRLDAFEPVPYAGGDLSGRGFMRDFRSTIALIDETNGTTRTATASLNSPAFFKLPSRVPLLVPGESWLLSQASWNPQNLDFTVLQVGNRPAVGMMVTACGLIFVGLMYAFYAKPIIIRKMKQRAVREAKSKPRPQREAPALVPVSSAAD